MIRELTPGEFNRITRYLKRLDDIGDDFFLYGDVICPSIRNASNFPGMHIVMSDLPTFDQYKDVLYGIFNLNKTSTEMGEVKGKKLRILFEQTDVGIWIELNEHRWQLAGIYSKELEEDGHSQAEIADSLKPVNNKFKTYMESVEWHTLDSDSVNAIKNGSVCVLEDERRTTYVRFGKDILKLKGQVRRDLPAKFSLDVCIISPESSEDIIVVNLMSGGLSSGTMMIHMMDEVIECIHYYKYSPFR